MLKKLLSLTLALAVLCTALPFALASQADDDAKNATLSAEFNRLVAEHGAFEGWSLAVKAAYGQFMADTLGTPLDPTFIYGIPGEQDITEEEAIRIAVQALVDRYGTKYGETEEQLGRFTPWLLFNVANPDDPEYTVSFDNLDPEQFGAYYVWIKARTGEVFNCWSFQEDEGQG